MKLLIFTCLVAVAFARPKLPLRHPELIQNEPDSTEEVLKQRKFFKSALEYNNEWNKQKIPSSSSSSEEVVPTSTKEQLSRTNEYNHAQRREPIINQLDVYPYAVWYYPPQIIQYIPYLPFYDITKPITSVNIEKTDIMPEW